MDIYIPVWKWELEGQYPKKIWIVSTAERPINYIYFALVF